MASKRAAICVAVLLAATGLVSLGSGVSAATQDANPQTGVVAVLGLPEQEAEVVFAGRPFALGLGVFPTSRDPFQFIQEMGYGSPRKNGEERDSSRISRALLSNGFRVGTDGPQRIVRPLAEALVGRLGFRNGCCGFLDIQAFDTADEAISFMRDSGEATYVILGVGEETPIQVGICRSACTNSSSGNPASIVSGSITRRPGIVTPYDLGVTILNRLGVSPIPDSFIGKSLTSESDPDALARIEALARRLERDDSFAPGLAASTVGSGGLLVIFAWLLSRLGRRALAMRLAQAAVFVLPGWILAEFIPSSAWGVRAIPVFAGALLGAILKPRDPVRTMARVGFASVFAFAVLVAIAPLNPGGEPGLSIWGNPLVSWRFFGMQNVQAAIVASGVVVWGVLARLAAPALAVVALGAAIVTGAPAVGANFVGVLTFVFGAAVANTALVRRRVSVRQIVGSAVVAVGAFVLALLADAGSPVSHGGRAARRISSDGWSAAWDLIEGRLRLNVELIRDFSGGWIFVALLLATMTALIAWGLRPDGRLQGRVAVLAGALMALASMVLEDSGFYSGAVLWFVTADAWLLVTLAGGLGIIPPESDAPLAGVGSGTRPPQPGSARRSRSWRR